MWSPWKRNKINIEEQGLDPARIPAHIAIIMDGNGRWAQQRTLPRSLGHRAGVEAVRSIVKCCSQLGVKVLTLYAFSTENWRRPKDEVGALMSLLNEYLRREIKELHENQVVVRLLGDLKTLPKDAQEELNHAINLTKDNTGLILNLAINYGGRAEIVEAIRKINKDIMDGKLDLESIDENTVSSYLFTAGQPDPDLLIRTSGEMRISNFLLWQLAYTEIVVLEEFWPDFSPDSLIKAIKIYQNRNRRFGGVSSKE